MKRVIILIKKTKFTDDEIEAIKQIFNSVYHDCDYDNSNSLIITFTDDGVFSNKELIESIISELTIDIKAFESHLLVDTISYIKKILPLLLESKINKYYIRESDLILEMVFKEWNFSFFDEKIDDDLLYTVKVFLECNMNTSKAANELFVHRNTLINKLDKFNKLTGYDIRDFSDAVLIYSLIRK